MADTNHTPDNHKNGVTDYHNHPSAAVVVIMVPLPMQGHLNQLLHLTRLISAHNVPVHFACTATHNRQAKTRLHGWDLSAAANTIHFHDFPTPVFDNPLPNPDAAATNFPTQILPSLISSAQLQQPVYDLVDKLSQTAGRIVIIYDSTMPYVVQDCRFIPNAESYSFQSISAFSLYCMCWERTGKPAPPSEAEIVKEVPSIQGCIPPEFAEFYKLQKEAIQFNSGDIYNTSRLIEGLYLDRLAKEKLTGTDKNWAIGPFNPVSVLPDQKNQSVITSPDDKNCLEWLDKQSPNSVVFVSFGSSSTLCDEQITELALGLEKSGHSFIWVLRDADRGDIFDGEIRRAQLPENYEERVRGRGLVLREWAPQLAILNHPSTGVFVTHCGWNSCMESISMGVPVATWPMHSDQPMNAVLMTKVLKIGLELKDWSRRNEVVSAGEVEKVVRRLMGSDEGDEIRQRAMELGDSVRKSVTKGGISSNELASFIAHITR